MKSFKDYLTESKRVYEFKVKIAGDHVPDAAAQIKASLAEFHVAKVSAPRSTPIQERQTEFPEHRNTQMTVYDVTTDYPATSLQLRDRIATGLGITHNHVKVKSLAEEKEYEINHEYDERTGKALVGTMQEPSDHGDLVNDTYKMNFLKELNREKHQGTQVKGFNDEILAAGAPKHVKETPGKQAKVETKKFANIFTKQVKVPTAKGATK
jgi:hypothetical protein